MAFERVLTKGGAGGPSSEPYQFEEKGQALTGRLLHKGEVSTEFGVKKKYIIETTDGNKSILGSFQLDERLALVSENKLVRITFQGREKTKNGKVKLFDVEVDNES